MTKMYTGLGDDGYTGLLGDERVPKHHPRPEAVGTLDEASAALGLARSTCLTSQTQTLLLDVQRDLYHMMAEVSAIPENAQKFRVIDGRRVTWLEQQTDSISAMVAVPQGFILPGDSIAGAALALGRTIVRRAERRVADLVHSKEVENREILRYLNRLSSLCFALELLENQKSGNPAPSLAKEK
jgi:cob(I)alamin adenosyltransferase